jgi:hypothetical protein
MAEFQQEPVTFSQLRLLENILKGEIKGLRQENDTIKFILIGLVVVLFVGYVALLVAVIALVFAFFANL